MIKVPLLLLNAYLSDKVYTPPTAPPSQSEFVNDKERVVARVTMLVYKLILNVCWDAPSTKRLWLNFILTR